MIQGEQRKQLQSIITPDIKAQFDQFLKGSSKELNRQKSQPGLFDKIYTLLFHFDEVDSKKMQRLLSYTSRNKALLNDDEVRSLYTKYNFSIIGGIIVAFAVPRRKVTKAFLALGVMLLKIQYLDNILFYRIISHEANTNVLNSSSQQYRNVLNFYARRRLNKQTSHAAKNLLTALIDQMQANTKQYQLYLSKAHLL